MDECSDCRFWSRSDPETGSEGLCRRYAPKPWAVGLREPLGSLSPLEPGQHPFADWPATLPTDWCGEYQYKGFNPYDR